MKQRKNLIVRLHAQILSEIISGTFAEGQRLVVEELARRYQVNRTPVRSALAILAQQGFLSKGNAVHIPAKNAFLELQRANGRFSQTRRDRTNRRREFVFQEMGS